MKKIGEKSDSFRGGVVYLFPGVILCTGRVADTAEHSHHAIQICLAAGGNLSVKCGGIWRETKALAIAPDTIHQLGDTDAEQYHMLLDPDSTVGTILKRTLHFENGVCHLDAVSGLDTLINRLHFASDCNEACRVASDALKMIVGMDFDSLLPIAKEKRSSDPRIELILYSIGSLKEKRVSVQSLADQLGLSESRIRHLFKEKIGISIRRYLLWLRLLDAVDYAFRKKSLTDAAHGAGFADSAHLSRTCKNMFGVNLSDIIQNSRYVQAFLCAGW